MKRLLVNETDVNQLIETYVSQLIEAYDNFLVNQCDVRSNITLCNFVYLYKTYTNSCESADSNS